MMKLIVIGNYPPRQCGISTFTQNLVQSIAAAAHKKTVDMKLEIIAMNDDRTYDYPAEVNHSIQQDSLTDYFKAAEYINENADACIIQHEYGIFGGEHGSYILNLTDQLQIPFIVTFHTVLKEPGFVQQNILYTLARKAYKVVVMSKKATQFLQEAYNIPSHKISIIEHGVPNFEPACRQQLRQEFGFSDKKILLTFGLLGRGKGIETVIQSLPKLVQQHPNVQYWLLGKTHPNVVLHEGEAYRESLQEMAEQLGVADNLVLKNEFVDEKTLFDYLSAADIYVTPYVNEAQITSGTLSYAIGAGVPVLSTPYWHAQELLSEGRGQLFDFKNSEQLCDMLTELLHEPDKLEEMRRRASTYGKTLKWNQKGAEYLQTLLDSVQQHKHSAHRPRASKKAISLPELNLSHIFTLTDSTGIIQHAKYAIPNFFEGYCLDDNARALLATSMAHRQGHLEVAPLVTTYLSYIYYMQREDGRFRNFLGYDRRFLDQVGSEDSFGRTIWALGYALAYPPSRMHEPLIKELFFKAYANIEKLISPRAIAYSILGLCSYLEKDNSNENVLGMLKKLTQRLVDLYIQDSSPDWPWFEHILAYGNGFLPLALFRSLEYIDSEETERIALESTAFLEELTLNEGHLRPVGCHGFYRKGKKLCYYDQQPIDAMAMVLLYSYAYKLTGNEDFYDKAILSFRWYLGKNDLHLPLYNPVNGGCYDGLMQEGINLNQGAESTLSYTIARLAIGELQQEKMLLQNRRLVKMNGSELHYKRISFMKD